MKSKYMNPVFAEAKKDFDLFHSEYREYKKKVDQVSDLFKLKNRFRLRSDYLPTYFVGNIQDKNSKYVLFGINPGFSEKQNSIEKAWKKNSWKDYLNFTKNFFILFKDHQLKSTYYKRLSKLFCGLDNIELESYDEIYDYYHKYLLNIDLIPYHSTSFGISSKLSEEQKEYFKKRFESNLKFLKTIKTKLIIFNGNPFYLLLIKNGLVKHDKKIRLNKHVTMYFFKLNKAPCVLFDKFITQPAFGLSYKDLSKKIPNLIKKETSL